MLLTFQQRLQHVATGTSSVLILEALTLAVSFGVCSWGRPYDSSVDCQLVVGADCRSRGETRNEFGLISGFRIGFRVRFCALFTCQNTSGSAGGQLAHITFILNCTTTKACLLLFIPPCSALPVESGKQLDTGAVKRVSEREVRHQMDSLWKLEQKYWKGKGKRSVENIFGQQLMGGNWNV